ncbi:MAG: hypothetical protein ACJAUP_000692 [Cellvibrionaceae bacterium]|jgi:hypothetical protein
MASYYKLSLAVLAATFFLSIYVLVSAREGRIMDAAKLSAPQSTVQSIAGRWQKAAEGDCEIIYPS